MSIRKLTTYFRLESYANLAFLIKFVKFWNLGLNLADLAKFRPNSLILGLTLGFGGLRAAGAPLRPADPGISMLSRGISPGFGTSSPCAAHSVRTGLREAKALLFLKNNCKKTLSAPQQHSPPSGLRVKRRFGERRAPTPQQQVGARKGTSLPLSRAPVAQLGHFNLQDKQGSSLARRTCCQSIHC